MVVEISGPLYTTITNHDDKDSNGGDNCGLNECTTGWMALWTKTGILVGVVAAVITTIAHFPAQYAPVVRLAAKHTFSTTARLCYNSKHLQNSTVK